MGASAERRPRTQASDELKRGDLVWDDDLGWGVVLDDVGSGCTSGVSVTLECLARDGERHRPAFLVSWPDAGRVASRPGPLQVVLEPAKLRGRVESSIDTADDGLGTVVQAGSAAVMRADAPSVFRFAWALRFWRCDILFRDELSQLPEWVHGVVTPLAEGHPWGTYRDLRRRSDFCVGLLLSDRNLLARVAGAAAEADFDGLVEGRRERDAEELLAGLGIELQKVGSARGVTGAVRRCQARLLALRRQYGPGSKGFWDAQEGRIAGVVAHMSAELR